MTTESQINKILASPLDHEWSIQGFGMLRMYLDPEGIERLHIWDQDISVENVSTIHDHPWDFESRIVRGHLLNQRYEITSSDENNNYKRQSLVCGVGGHLIGEPEPVLVVPKTVETYGYEDVYSQEATEFHESFPETGAVTVIKRNFRNDRDIATVCWNTPVWISAEPRSATKEEILHFIALIK